VVLFFIKDEPQLICFSSPVKNTVEQKTKDTVA
jgi:hypothetical protein